MEFNPLVPELIVSDIAVSLAFYTEVLGFSVLFERPEERFAYLEREGATLMIEGGTGRKFLAAPLEHPYGRGMNLEIGASDVDALYAAVLAADAHVYLPMEEKWYRVGAELRGNRQFIVQDPDGYLLRFAGDIGRRPVA